MGEIVLKDIQMTLDPSSIDDAIRQIEDLQGNLKNALDALRDYLLKDGITIARLNLRRYGFRGKSSGSPLAQSIRVETADGKTGEGYLVAGYPGDHGYDGPGYENISYAVFIEFGFGAGAVTRSKKTGKVKAAHGTMAHHIATEKAGYKYGVNGFKKGTTPKGQTFRGWVYKNRKNDHFYVSQGQPPKPFMYDTLLDLADKADKDGGRIIAEYIP